jgi:hypothetical protein
MEGSAVLSRLTIAQRIRDGFGTPLVSTCGAPAAGDVGGQSLTGLSGDDSSAAGPAVRQVEAIVAAAWADLTPRPVARAA